MYVFVWASVLFVSRCQDVSSLGRGALCVRVCVWGGGGGGGLKSHDLFLMQYEECLCSFSSNTRSLSFPSFGIAQVMY